MSQVTTRVIGQGGANFVLHVSLASDGVEGELDNYVLVDPATFIPPLPRQPALRIMQIWSSMVWFDIVIKYGGLVPRPAWTLARDTTNYIDFRVFGGISDDGQPPPSDDNGKVLISTNGFEAAGSQGNLVIAFRKS